MLLNDLLPNTQKCLYYNQCAEIPSTQTSFSLSASCCLASNAWRSCWFFSSWCCSKVLFSSRPGLTLYFLISSFCSGGFSWTDKHVNHDDLIITDHLFLCNKCGVSTILKIEKSHGTEIQVNHTCSRRLCHHVPCPELWLVDILDDSDQAGTSLWPRSRWRSKRRSLRPTINCRATWRNQNTYPSECAAPTLESRAVSAKQIRHSHKTHHHVVCWQAAPQWLPHAIVGLHISGCR